MELQLQRSDIINKFYKNYYHPSMKRGGPLEVELIISPICNLGCKYCYVTKHYSKCYPLSTYDPEIVFDNIKKLLMSYTKMGLAPDLELFSGEFFAQEISYRILDWMYEYYKSLDVELRPSKIVIPSNFTFICKEELTKRVESYIFKFDELDIMFVLSASVDGLYMEENRPLTHSIDIDIDVVRDQAYYDRVIQFCLTYGYGFHPMVSAFNIENWIKNFTWWQEQLEKHNMMWDSIYLLEVRDGDTWTDKQLYHYQQFIRFLYYFAYNKFQDNHDLFVRWLIPTQEDITLPDECIEYGAGSWDNGFNILSNAFMHNTNGIGCNIQQHTAVRCSDLTIVPCHRLMYPQFYIGQYQFNDDGTSYIKGDHVELGLVLPMIDDQGLVKCNDCPINKICGHNCLGAQYEKTKDPFTALPTICNLNYAKIDVLIQCLKETNLYHKVLERIMPEFAFQFIDFERIQKGVHNAYHIE